MRFADAILSAWARFRSSTRGCGPAANKHTQSDARPILIPKTLRYEEGKLPTDLPDSDGLRVVADYLEFLIPAADALALVRARDYTAAHELAGVHEAIHTIRQWAVDLDELNRATAAQEGEVQ
ncbi:hypothetical protein J2788_005016 [Variovorax paradoxus]|nr:hypothetical protein [Variovorax paradoxus]